MHPYPVVHSGNAACFFTCRSPSLSALCLMFVTRLIYCQIALMRLFHGKWRNSPPEFKIFRGCSQLPVVLYLSFALYLSGICPFRPGTSLFFHYSTIQSPYRRLNLISIRTVGDDLYFSSSVVNRVESKTNANGLNTNDLVKMAFLNATLRLFRTIPNVVF